MMILYTQPIVANNFNGTWHLRVIDGMDVRKARAILDFNMIDMKLSGFDACNRIEGILTKHTKTLIVITGFRSSRMECRGRVYSWVKKRLHSVLKKGFKIKEETKYGIKGITLKSRNHELFRVKLDD